MPIDLTALKNEIQNGPLKTTLAPLVTAKDWTQIASILNDKAQGGGTIEPSTVTARQLLGAVVGSEYVAASWTAAMRDLWRDILNEASRNAAPIKSAAFRNLVLAAVPSAASATRANLAALQTRAASRIELLFGEDLAVEAQQVYKAMVEI